MTSLASPSLSTSSSFKRVYIQLSASQETEKRDVLAVSLSQDHQTIHQLTLELVEKFKLKSDALGRAELRLAHSGALLDENSKCNDLLQNEDSLLLCPIAISEACTLKHSIYSNTYQQLHLVIHHQTSLKVCVLDGYSLSIEDLMSIGFGNAVQLSDNAIDRVLKTRQIVNDIVESGKAVYGINTGFGRFAAVPISKDNVSKLQENLIRSHASCVGEPLSLFRTRLLMALRINVLAKGCSGIRLETLQQLVKALNASCLPCVPQKGTVGASGDLGPLAHLALGMMGEGEMWGPQTGWKQANEVLSVHGIAPVKLEAKEGLALINGTQFISALGCEAYHRAKLIADQADIISALSIDVLQGTPKAFDQDIHLLRPHQGQQLVASRLRSLLDSNIHPSEIRENHKNCTRVQDPYTMRCVPQVHGIVHDTLEFVLRILTTEINSATDNPLILANRAEIISGGNFHGEYPAKALDYLAICIHEIANMSERRLERMIHPAYSELPAFLVKNGGLNSGFMMAQVTAASLVSENKVLTHPSSVDSISTSAGTEDHVSMGGFAARKVLSVVENVEQVVAIELMAACQALEFHRPRKTTLPLEQVYKLVRTVVGSWENDRFLATDISAVTNLLQEGKVWEVASPYITSYLQTNSIQ